MVLEFKGYDPTEVGIRKFLSTHETEMLKCLWNKKNDGAMLEELRDQLAEEGSPHSPTTIKKALDGLGKWGLVEAKIVARSAPRICYFAAVEEKKVTTHLVERFLSSVKTALPEEFARAAREQGII